MSPAAAGGDACAWCGTPVPVGDGFRVFEPAGERRAAFCRLEHIVPWAIRGAAWEPGDPAAAAPSEAATLRECAWCGSALGDARVLVVRSRGEQHVADGFCTFEHLLAWAKAGGRYAIR